jgi:methylmalonyl-CoA mutase N-terminal domain/subunit
MVPVVCGRKNTATEIIQVDRRDTSSGIEIEPLYEGTGREQDPPPGEFPFVRGPYPSMHRGRLWTMRQYAGFGTAEATNQRFQELLTAGQTGLSVAFDLPTQMGLDSDHRRSLGEVGKVGVAIDSIHDMRRLFDGIPLADISTSMTINSTAPLLLLMYQMVAEEQGVPASGIRGTIQNDILKEYIARGTYIYPPRPSMRLVTDVFAYCAEALPAWNTISISGYHIREAGSTAAQELAFTIANAIAYVEAATAAGMDVDEFGPRLSFFWNSHKHFFEEIAKFRAARRMWAHIMRDRFGATNPKALAMRFHTQTAGSSLTAQQPEGNIVRTAVEAMAAVFGGTQSLHTNAYDEALGLPTPESARLALRTQQILGFEMGLADSADPLGGSHYVEALTDELERLATALIADIDELGGAVSAIEDRFQERLIEEAAYVAARRVDSGDDVVVGLNRFIEDGSNDFPTLQVDPALAEDQTARLDAIRGDRDSAEVAAALDAVKVAAEGTANMLPVMKVALQAEATIGEISDVLRDVFGTR